MSTAGKRRRPKGDEGAELCVYQAEDLPGLWKLIQRGLLRVSSDSEAHVLHLVIDLWRNDHQAWTLLFPFLKSDDDTHVRALAALLVTATDADQVRGVLSACHAAWPAHRSGLLVWNIISAEDVPPELASNKTAVIEAVRDTPDVNAQWIIFYQLKVWETQRATVQGHQMVTDCVKILDEWQYHMPPRLARPASTLRASLLRAASLDWNPDGGNVEAKNADLVRVTFIMLKDFILLS